jgi:hypothetical protein
MYKYGYIEWEGGLGIGTVTPVEPLTAGRIIVSLETKLCYCYRNSPNPFRAYGKYLVTLFGLSIGLPASFTFGDVNVISPSVLGPDPRMLAGNAIWLSGTIAFGEGRSYTLFTMGFGIARIGLTPEAVFGIDASVDVLVGVSLPVVPFLGMHPCAN